MGNNLIEFTDERGIYIYLVPHISERHLAKIVYNLPQFK